MAPGFGYFDACEYEAKADSTSWIIQDILPKNSFGFIAGPPKGNASPHGGKSVLQRKLALSIITGKDFFGKKVLETGRVMFLNLDEDQDKQVRLYYRMTGGAKIPGYLISKARSCRLPEQIKLFSEDVKDAKPLVALLDPLQRAIGSRAVRRQEDIGPIINDLKRIGRENNCTIGVSHHSNKDADRDKELTASWLSGSVDLDAAWDFCICLEYDKKAQSMHMRNFQKEKAKTDLYYEAEIINKDEIIDLYPVIEELKDSHQARQIYHYLLKNMPNMPVNSPNTPTQWSKILEPVLGIAASSIRYQIDKYAVIKNIIKPLLPVVENNEVKVRSEALES